MGDKKNAHKIFVEEFKEGVCTEDPDVDSRVTMKCIIKP
jgi:hypothetical protein